MARLKTTSQHTAWWAKRKIDWDKDYLATWTHPHRALIVAALRTIPWISLWEVGCGPAPNQVRLLKEGFTGRQMGGSDVNEDAIALARKTFVGGKFHVEPAHDLLLSDNSVDVILSDAALIYVGPPQIKKTIKELVRVARNHIVLCEFHGGTLWERTLLRWRTGYNAYDYKALLEDAGCYDVKVVKIPKEFWEGFPWQPWGYIIIAKIAKI